MRLCKSEIAEQFIGDRLSDRESSEFEQHLETCLFCRAELEKLAGAPNEWSETTELLSSSTEVRCWSQAGSSHPNSIPTSRLQPHDLSMLAPTDDPESMGRLGGYEVTGVIGRGGMGVVFKASDRSLGRNVAVKVLDPSLAGVGAARSRFAREARAMAAVSHEHVVPIYAVDEHAGLPYFAMEYVAGGTLDTRIQREGTLDVLSIVRIAHQVALALAAAHECGLVHRDIKPANILLDRGIERVRVTDFGLARVANDASHTRSGYVAGTPQFMSPEQVRGEACDTRSDLFSLGCVIYAMCVGHSPFRAESLYGAMQRIVHDTPRSICRQNHQIPEWLEQFTWRLLEKQPNQRFESAEQVAELLATELHLLQNPSDSLLPNRPWMKGKSALRRLAVASMFAVVAVLCVGLVLWIENQWGGKANNSQTTQVEGQNEDAEKDAMKENAATAMSQATEDSTTIDSPDLLEDIWNEAAVDAAESMAALQSAIDALDAEIHRSPTPEDPTWNDNVDRIRRDLQTLFDAEF